MASEIFDNLNALAFHLVSILEEREPEPSQPAINENLVGSPPIINLGPINNLKLLKTEPFGSNVSVFHAIDKSYIGLSESNYFKFKQIVTQIQEIPIFSTKTTFSFIEEEAFNWLIEVYKNKKAEKNLIDYLLDTIENEYKEYTFFFKLYPFSIEKPFIIGNSEITFLTQEFIEQERQKFISSGKTLEEFHTLFKEFNNKVLIKVKAKGVKSRAEEIAFHEAEISTDVLKCLLHEYSIYGQYCLPEIDHRFTQKNTSVHIYNYPSEKFTFGFSISNQGNNVPIQINEEKLNTLNSNHLKKFSNFLINKKENDFYYLTIDAIKTFSDLVSTNNRYERVVKIISFFEAIIIDTGTKKGKGETIIKSKLIPKILKTSEDLKLGIELTGYFFRIRDAYLQHRIHRLIDYIKIYQYQTIAFRFLYYLVENNANFNSREDFISFLNSK